MAFPTWRYNPQIFVQSDEPQEVQLQVAQDIRSKFYIGVVAGKTNGRVSRQLALEPNQIVNRTEPEANQSVKTTIELEAGVLYVVIPSTFSPGEEGKYLLTFTSSKELKISELPPGEEWKYVTQKGEWKGKSSGGCLNHETFANNPQFVLKAELLTNAIILLTQSPTQSESESDTVGLYVFETKSVKAKLTAAQMAPKEMRASSDFSRTIEATCEIQLQPKKIYCIVPCTFEPGHQNAFDLTVFSDHDIKLHELKGTAAPATGSKSRPGEKGEAELDSTPSAEGLPQENQEPQAEN